MAKGELMKKGITATICVAAALGLFSAVLAYAEDMTPAQLADARVKAETANRLVTFGRQMKDPNMLMSAARLMNEVGPMADPAQGMKDGKPVRYDVGAILSEAGKLGADTAAVDKLKMSIPSKQNECVLFYNCLSDNSVCWWDHWC
ncbi:hypothetical protein BH10PSE7_BH10PSE7_11320 [soil metagenome]